MAEYGINVKHDSGGKRLEIQCKHQNGLLYVVPSEASWVCTEELLHAHAQRAVLLLNGAVCSRRGRRSYKECRTVGGPPPGRIPNSYRWARCALPNLQMERFARGGDAAPTWNAVP